MLLGDFNAKIKIKITFKSTVGSKSPHCIGNDNGTVLINGNVERFNNQQQILPPKRHSQIDLNISKQTYKKSNTLSTHG